MVASCLTSDRRDNALSLLAPRGRRSPRPPKATHNGRRGAGAVLRGPGASGGETKKPRSPPRIPGPTVLADPFARLTVCPPGWGRVRKNPCCRCPAGRRAAGTVQGDLPRRGGRALTIHQVGTAWPALHLGVCADVRGRGLDSQLLAGAGDRGRRGCGPKGGAEAATDPGSQKTLATTAPGRSLATPTDSLPGRAKIPAGARRPAHALMPVQVKPNQVLTNGGAREIGRWHLPCFTPDRRIGVATRQSAATPEGSFQQMEAHS
jgi:hypothetical protein